MIFQVDFFFIFSLFFFFSFFSSSYDHRRYVSWIKNVKVITSSSVFFFFFLSSYKTPLEKVCYPFNFSFLISVVILFYYFSFMTIKNICFFFIFIYLCIFFNKRSHSYSLIRYPYGSRWLVTELISCNTDYNVLIEYAFQAEYIYI